MTCKKSITKQELAQILNISAGTLRTYLNIDMFEKLEPLGYKKTTHILTGKVLQCIKEHYCIHDNEL